MADILIVEPDNLLARTYQAALKKAGHTSRRVKTAQAAIAILDQIRADVVILELQLVKHNGIEFLYEMRSYTDWQDLPVIIHSFTTPEIMKNKVLCQHIGVTKYLYKPSTSLSDLLEAIAEVAQDTQVATPTAGH